MGEMLPEILQPFTRYSANDPEFPVNDTPLFAGCCDQDFRKTLFVGSKSADGQGGAATQAHHGSPDALFNGQRRTTVMHS